jgi:hypothetical protein
MPRFLGWTGGVRALAAAGVALLATTAVPAATKTIDLDGQSGNGAESKCDLNVLSTFPVKVENIVTNKAVGNAFDFRWPSAGPGGFTSSAAPGSSGGVGAKWTWTTNQSVFSFTGSSCEKDICFLKTEGPDPMASTCSLGCLDDGVTLGVEKGSTAGEVVLNWSGGTANYTVYRSAGSSAVTDPANTLTTTSALTFSDLPPGATAFYVVRGATCLERKPCTTDAQCNPVSEGTCVSRGPFQVPGRSLTSTDITVSSASLTSSLITFFSPPTEVFSVTSTAQPGAFQETLTNGSTTPVTVVTEAYPPGCCPVDPEVPDQLRCGEECVDYLNDPLNCGACGNVCGDGTCCTNGNCVSLCADGQVWCDGRCVDLRNDSENCGACGTVCADGNCCFEGVCASFCGEDQSWCGDGLCADLENDSQNCGACGNVCGEGTCCNGGVCESLCAEGQTWCDGQCVDLQNDSTGCGACGNVCGEGTCCADGVCASVCAPGQTWCDGQCVDLQNDSASCGACGNVCGPGSCCNDGACVSTCEPGRTFCDGLCYDLQNDPLNCGGCGNVCAEDSICTGGACVPCSGQGGAKDACDNRCVNTNTDPYNCGGCGIVCNLDCPSGFTGVCSNGQSCRCEAGTPAPSPPPNTPAPTQPVCPNPDPSSPVGGVCPNANPTFPFPGECANPNPSPGPAAGMCPNPSPTWPVPGWCPSPGPPAPDVEPTPDCLVEAGEETVPPGGSTTICRPAGLLFREVAASVSVCGDTIPGPDGACADGVSNVSTGTFMRFVPDTETEIGDAFMTPYSVHVASDDSRDGLLQPGETVDLFVRVLNAGPVPFEGASATLLAAPIDLTDDGLHNPVTMSIVAGTSSYGTIPGTQPSVDCAPVALQPVANAVAFRVAVPAEHPGDTSTPFTLRFEGTVAGAPFEMEMPIALGVADRCVYADATRDYDGLDGLRDPMARLVPVGDPVPFPDRPFNGGQTRPLKLRLLCGGVNLRGDDVDAAEIVGLSESTRGPLDIRALDLNDDTNSNDPFFRWNDQTQQWIYNMRTSQIGTGVFTLTIRVAGRKDYVTGFELR